MVKKGAESLVVRLLSRELQIAALGWAFFSNNLGKSPMKCYQMLFLKLFYRNIWSVYVAVVILHRFCGSQYDKLRERFF